METEMMNFRGYDKVEKVLYNSIGYIDFTNKTCQLGRLDFEQNHYPEVKRDFKDIVLLRSTGKSDHSGCEIFEGHIVVDDDVRYIVEWCKEDAMFTLNTRAVSLNFAHLDSHWLEIIGTIFDDKHLVEDDSDE